jgi:hypothetical protein
MPVSCRKILIRFLTLLTLTVLVTITLWAQGGTGDLPVVGSYTLEIAAKGFRGYPIADIIISVGVTTAHDAKLEIGTSREGVIVTAGSQRANATVFDFRIGGSRGVAADATRDPQPE